MKRIAARILNKAVPMKIRSVAYLDCLDKKGLIDRNHYYDSLTDLVLRKVLKDDSICVDVGCHRGDILRMMMKYAPQGKFYTFEPLPHLFEYLKEKYEHHLNVSVSDIALSDIAGESPFNYVVTNPGYSGFRKRRYDRPNEEDTQISVKADLMDSLLAGVTVDLIKIDVEGAELQVFRGAKELIERDKPFIVFEHGAGAADCYETKPEEVYDLLCEYCGLKLALLNRYLLNIGPLSRKEFCEQFYEGLNYYFLAYND